MSAHDNIQFAYPYLSNKCTLFVYKTHGHIECVNNKNSYRITSAACRIIAKCNGTSSFANIIEEITDGNTEDGDEIADSLVLVCQLVKKKIIRMNDFPKLTSPRIIDKSHIHYPKSMHIEVTSGCNLHCHYCYRDAHGVDKCSYINTNKLYPVLGELINKGLTTVEITGGEPLVHPNIKDILLFCCNNIPIVTILSNGTLIDNDVIDLLHNYKSKLFLNISLNSHIERDHDLRTGIAGSFNKTTNAIRLLSSHGFSVRVAMVVDEHNWPHVENTLLLAKHLGATRFSYSSIMPTGRGASFFNPWSLDQDDVYKSELYLRDMYGDFLHLITDTEKKIIQSPGGCGMGNRAYAMDPYGNVRLCVSFDSRAGVLGSLFNESIDSVFGNTMTQSSAQLIPPSIELCRPCKYSFFCNNCSLRGYIASSWAGESNCTWLNLDETRKWRNMLHQNMHVEL